MTTRAFCNVDGHTVLEATIVVPNVGPWYATLSFQGAPDVSGRVTLTVGSLELRGVIDVRNDGVFGEQRRSRIVGGAGGWGTLLPALAYHNDAGVRSLTVAQDAARLAGEELGSFDPEASAIGNDYVRQAGLASRVLEDVIGAVPWHVGFDGRTNVGEREVVDVDAEAYEVLDVEPRVGLATLALDDVSAVGIGSRLTRAPLVGPVVVTELEIRVEVGSLRATAWYGAVGAGATALEASRSLSARGRIAQAMRAIARRALDGTLFGRYRYRVVQMSGDRVELQAVRAGAGLPDILPITQQPGIAGSFAKLVGGAVVLVEFIEGDRTMPVITGFAPKGEPGHAPDELTFDVVTQLRLGGPSASDAVALAPTVDSQLDDINQALDAFAVAVPVPNDGGAAIQTAFRAVWGPGAPPRPPSNVGATKVVAL